MAKSTGRTGIGVLLKMGDGESPEIMTPVSNVTQLSAGGVTLNTVDATHLGSPDLYSEFLPTLKAADEWTFTLQWDPNDPTHAGTGGLRSKLENRLLTTFQVDPSAIGLDIGFEADAYVTQLGNVEITPDGIMNQQCTLRPSGKVREANF